VKKVLVVLLTLVASAKLHAQSEVGKAQVTIIGTIHNGNSHFDYKTLFHILERIKPDIILVEQSEPFRRVFGLQTASFLRIWHPGIEQRALQKYTRKYKHLRILPYDTLIPETRKYARTLSSNTQTVMNLLADAANNGQMTKEDSLTYAVYIEKRNSLFAFISDTTLERINKPDVIKKTKEIYQSYSPVLLNLVNNYIKDSALANWYRYEDNFWVQRNIFMGKQVVNTIVRNKGKKIVVLTGLAHSYFLHDYIGLHKPDMIFNNIY